MDTNKTTKSQTNKFLNGFYLLLLLTLSIAVPFVGLKILSSKMDTANYLGGFNVSLLTAFLMGVCSTALVTEAMALANCLIERMAQRKSASFTKGEQ